jgi:hypothetical protein
LGHQSFLYPGAIEANPMTRTSLALISATLLVTGVASNAVAQDRNSYPYSIMREEGGARAPMNDPGWEGPEAAPKKQVGKRRIGSSSPSPLPPVRSLVTPLGTVQRPIETQPLGTPSSPGMIVPGARTTTGGPAMTPPRPAGQSFQDRAVNCVASSGGVAAGKVGSYTRSCVNQ